MKTSAAAARYAKSLLSLALEQGSLEKVKDDMAIVAKACHESHDLQVVLNSPVIKSDKKGAILQEIFGSQITDLSKKFIELLTNKSREALIPQIADEFVVLYNSHKGVITAIVTSANGLDENLRKKVMETIKNSVKSEVALIENVDNKLIGGFILSIGDKQIDASVARSLKNLKQEFSAN
jgi:F-type H+-transporting ATPase subunit delta